MPMIKYTVSRNVKATDAQGNDVLIAMCLIEHENGQRQRLAIPEAKIQFCGEGLIDIEVAEAAANPSTASLLNGGMKQ